MNNSTATQPRVARGVPSAGEWRERHRDPDGLHLEAVPVLDLPYPDAQAKLAAVAEVARAFMDEHGLTDWHFQFDNGTTRLGACIHDEHTISLSRAASAENTHAEIVEVIAHEVAHALAGKHVVHGPKWKKIAAALGARPQAKAEPTTYHLRVRAEREAAVEADRAANVPHSGIAVGDAVELHRPGKRVMAAVVTSVYEHHYGILVENVLPLKAPCSWVKPAPRPSQA